MSIFDGLRGQNKITLDSKSAVLLSCILMVSADGSVDDDEMAIIRRIDGSGSTNSWDAAVKAYNKLDRSAAFDLACESLSRDHLMPLMANLIDIAMADGELAGDEKRLLEKFLLKLQPDVGEITSMVDVISVKNSIRTI